MKSTIAKSRFEWVSSPDFAFTELEDTTQDIAKTPYPIPIEIGEGWYQSFHLPMNMVIRVGRLNFSRELVGRVVSLAHIVEHLKEPHLVIHSARKGRFMLLQNRLGKEFIHGPDTCVFEHVEDRELSIKLDASEDMETITLLLSNSLLNELLGEDHAKELLTALQLTVLPSATAHKVPQHLTSLLHSSISDTLTGNIGKLHTQAKVLDYICALSQYFRPSFDQPQTEINVENTIMQMHDDLIRLEGKVPSLNELAIQYHLSLSQVKEGFKKIYGKSVFNYVTEVRLNDAHGALLNSDVPMKTLAKNLGYSHVNHFITAFRKQFGYPPGQLRKKKIHNTDIGDSTLRKVK